MFVSGVLQPGWSRVCRLKSPEGLRAPVVGRLLFGTDLDYHGRWGQWGSVENVRVSDRDGEEDHGRWAN